MWDIEIQNSWFLQTVVHSDKIVFGLYGHKLRLTLWFFFLPSGLLFIPAKRKKLTFSCYVQNWFWSLELKLSGITGFDIEDEWLVTVIRCRIEIQCLPLNWITDNRISRLLLSDIAGPIISTQIMLVNWIIWLVLSLFAGPNWSYLAADKTFWILKVSTQTNNFIPTLYLLHCLCSSEKTSDFLSQVKTNQNKLENV